MKFFKLKPKEQWQLVKTLDAGITYGADNKKGTVYYHLFESDRGNRRCQIRSTVVTITPDIIEKSARSFDVYHTTIYRWLAGRLDPDIVKYDEVGQEEAIHTLKGTIKETF